MTTLCRGEKCPVRKQCSRYTAGLDEKRNGSDDRYILQCRSQRMFTNEDLTPAGDITGISQETADELSAAFKALADFDPVPQFLKSFREHMKLKMADVYLSIAHELADASYKASTKSIFTRWWWKRKACKLSKQLDGVMGAIAILSEKKGGDQ